MTVRDDVLMSSDFISNDSSYIRINEEKLVEVVESFKNVEFKHWLSSVDFGLEQKDLINMIFVMHSIGFSFWEDEGQEKWEVEFDGEKDDGVFGTVIAFKRALSEGVKVFDYEYLANFKQEDLAHILRGNVEIPMLLERFEILQSIGQTMSEKFGGDFNNVVKEAESFDNLVRLIIDNFMGYDDKAKFYGEEVCFYKRAQLVAYDVFVMLGRLNEVEITCLADYKTPMVLRELGILEYAPELADKIERKEKFLSGYPEEIELRGNAVFAVNMIHIEVLKKNPEVKTYQINDYLWLLGQDKTNRKHPYHRCRSVFY